MIDEKKIEEAAKNAYNYCVNRGFIKDTLCHG